MNNRRYFIVGGAGFIGSHFTDALLADPTVAGVTLYDNFSSGQAWHHAHHAGEPRLTVVHGEVGDLEELTNAMEGHQVVIHLASNPDIARAVREPDIDFWEGTALTNNVVEAARRVQVSCLLYASGSGVYGDRGEREAGEDDGPFEPISTYGASKLAGEALIRSYCYMFGMRGLAFRFGNVVGFRQTHGVGLDFARALLREPTRLRILGDGTQSKSYVHVQDVVAAVLRAEQAVSSGFAVFNVATGDYVTVREIADIACQCVGLRPADVHYEFTGGNRGWKGDVPIVRLNTDRIRALGWRPTRTSAQAVREAISAILTSLRQGEGGA